MTPCQTNVYAGLLGVRSCQGNVCRGKLRVEGNDAAASAKPAYLVVRENGEKLGFKA